MPNAANYFNIAGIFYRELQGLQAESKIVDIISRKEDITTDPVLVSNMLDEYTWTDVPVPYYISCSDAGAIQTIAIYLLDAAYKVKVFTVTLLGQAKIPISPDRMSRFLGATNIDTFGLGGDVYIFEDDTVTAGVPDDLTKVRGTIKAPLKDSRMGVFSIPHNYGGSMYFVEAKPFGTNLNRKGLIDVYIREYQQSFELRSSLPFQIQSGLPENLLQLPWLLKPLSDVMFVARTEFGKCDLAIRVSIMLRKIDRFHYSDLSGLIKDEVSI